MAAGQGFEPQLPGPEPGVLPLDDPATAASDSSESLERDRNSPLDDVVCHGRGVPLLRRLSALRLLRAADLEVVDGDESLLGLRVDARDHLDVRLEPRPAQLGLE